MSRRFDFDRGDIADRYDRGRALPADTIAQWLEEIARHVPAGMVRILDLGCGTGRFTAPLAIRFAARVCGLDLSEKMLSVARQTLGDSGATLVRAAAEAIPFSGGVFDVVFVSMVLHHIRSSAGAVAEMRRVLKTGGRLIVRTASVETMGSYLWTAFFREGAEVEASRVLTREAITTLLAGHGLVLESHRVVEQVFAGDLREYCEKISQRTLSSLSAIPDGAFESGLAALRKHCAAVREPGPVYEQVDLFVFRK